MFEFITFETHLPWAVAAHAFNPSSQGAEAGRSLEFPASLVYGVSPRTISQGNPILLSLSHFVSLSLPPPPPLPPSCVCVSVYAACEHTLGHECEHAGVTVFTPVPKCGGLSGTCGICLWLHLSLDRSSICFWLHLSLGSLTEEEAHGSGWGG